MKNSYAKELERRRTEREKRVKELTIQLMADTLSITLNDPDVMGKDTFGKDRLKKVLSPWIDNFELFYPAITDDVEADVARTHLDDRLKRIYKEDFQPSIERYGVK